jgi:hypothetical protein
MSASSAHSVSWLTILNLADADADLAESCMLTSTGTGLIMASPRWTTKVCLLI